MTTHPCFGSCVVVWSHLSKLHDSWQGKVFVGSGGEVDGVGGDLIEVVVEWWSGGSVVVVVVVVD